MLNIKNLQRMFHLTNGLTVLRLNEIQFTFSSVIKSKIEKKIVLSSVIF
jgi:hypothetical protein